MSPRMDQGNPRVRCKDPKFMPKEKSCWSAWNGLNLPGAPAVVTYWINKLQPGACTEGKDVFVTLNPPKDSSYSPLGNSMRSHVLLRLVGGKELWKSMRAASSLCLENMVLIIDTFTCVFACLEFT